MLTKHQTVLISLHILSHLILTLLCGCERSVLWWEDLESLEGGSHLPEVTAASTGSSQNSDPGLADSKAHILDYLNALPSMA